MATKAELIEEMRDKMFTIATFEGHAITWGPGARNDEFYCQFCDEFIGYRALPTKQHFDHRKGCIVLFAIKFTKQWKAAI